MLFTPSEKITPIILGIIGRGLELYQGVKIVEFIVLSNHYHFVLIADDEESLALFMGYVNGLLARKVAADFHGWRAKTWARRYRSIPIIGEKKMIKRARYLYSQGGHHELVSRPELWPGPSSIRARLFGEKLVGKWYDKTAMFRAQKRGIEVNPEDYVTLYEIELAPLPCWEHLSQEEYRDRIKSLAADIIIEHHNRWQLEGKTPLGADAILLQDPWSRPSNMKISDAPLVHASTEREEQAYRQALDDFYIEYADSSERFRNGEFHVSFPNYCFPPARPFERPGKVNIRPTPG